MDVYGSDRLTVTPGLLVFTGCSLAAQTLLSKSPLRRGERQSRVESESQSDNAGHSPMTTLKGIWGDEWTRTWISGPVSRCRQSYCTSGQFSPFHQALCRISTLYYKNLRLKACGNDKSAKKKPKKTISGLCLSNGKLSRAAVSRINTDQRQREFVPLDPFCLMPKNFCCIYIHAFFPHLF